MTASRLVGVSCLLTAKGVDVATTATGLLALPGGEANPIAAAIFAIGGLPGLVGLAVLVCALVIGVVEAGASVLRARSRFGPPAVRLAAYGTLTALWTAVAVANAHQIAGAIA